MKEPKTLKQLARDLRKDLKDKKNLLIFAYNRVGKTRLSMAFKNIGKRGVKRDTLYFNAFTEDLFVWDNDLDYDKERFLEISSTSRFSASFKDIDLETRVYDYLSRYADFEFDIDYEDKNNKNKWQITFSRGRVRNIKISRGEQNIFIWCVFLVIAQLALDGDESYKWVKYIYIDDPISSLDDSNVIAVACDLAGILKDSKNQKIKTIISSHHGLFFNVLSNELDNLKKYFLSKNKDLEEYYIQDIGRMPFSYHLAMLSELRKAEKTGKLYNYHFNILRTILEKTTIFFGFKKFSKCIDEIDNLNDDDKALFNRALNVFSHGKYLSHDPSEMSPENKELFKSIFNIFVKHYKFNPVSVSKK